MFNLGGRTRWLPWLLLHPGVWPAFPILRQIRRVGPRDMSARQFIERHGFRGRARVLAEMTLTAHLPGGLDDVGVRGLVEDRVLSLESGSYHRVADGYDRLSGYVGGGLDTRLGFPVAAVRWAADGVSVAAADGRELSARAAISTLPFGVLKTGAVRFTPELPESKRAAFAHAEMGPVFKLLLHFRASFWPSWLTNLGCGSGPVTLYWPVFYGAEFKPAVLTAYCTGPRAAHLSKLSESEVVDVVLADLRRLFPRANSRAALLAARRIDWARDSFACGGYTFLRPGGTGARERLAAAECTLCIWQAPNHACSAAGISSEERADAHPAQHAVGRRQTHNAGSVACHPFTVIVNNSWRRI
jgi:hypothetical protein